MSIHGPIVAALTPFNASNRVDYHALDEYLGFLEACGVPTIISCGTTGEFPSMNTVERKKVLEFHRAHFEGKIVANVSSCCLDDAIELLDHAHGHADAALALPPFYYAGASSEGLMAYFDRLLERAKMPVLLYNFPRHTQNPLTPEMVAALAERHASFAGIKNTVNDLESGVALRNAAPRLQVFVGADSQALEVLKRGLAGSATGAGTVFADVLVGIRRAFDAGKLDEAAMGQTMLNAWSKLRDTTCGDPIAGAKAAMGARVKGFPPFARCPFVTCSEEQTAALRAGVLELLNEGAPGR